jgi:hypothetical protein
MNNKQNVVIFDVKINKLKIIFPQKLKIKFLKPKNNSIN